MRHEIKEIIRKYKPYGFDFKNGSKHIIAVHCISGRKVTIARTPGDRRAVMNICKRLDRAMA